MSYRPLISRDGCRFGYNCTIRRLNARRGGGDIAGHRGLPTPCHSSSSDCLSHCSQLNDTSTCRFEIRTRMAAENRTSFLPSVLTTSRIFPLVPASSSALDHPGRRRAAWATSVAGMKLMMSERVRATIRGRAQAMVAEFAQRVSAHLAACDPVICTSRCCRPPPMRRLRWRHQPLRLMSCNVTFMPAYQPCPTLPRHQAAGRVSGEYLRWWW